MRSFVASEIETAETEAREYHVTRAILTSKIRSNFEAMRWEALNAVLRCIKRALLRILLAIRDVLGPLFHSHEVSILCYHSISNTYLDTAVAPEAFDQQLTVLEKSGAKFVPLEQILAWRAGTGILPRRAVALTFDDGYRDFRSTALPIRRQHKAPATVFVVGVDVASPAGLGNDLSLLTPEESKSLRTDPLVEIGYHSRTHANLAEISAADLEQECDPRSGARFFAYPGGRYSDAAINAVKNVGYEAAFSIRRGLVSSSSDVFLLPRNTVLRDMPPWTVRAYSTRVIEWVSQIGLA
jgi:peptidoglycan/xylan/chitin deacetylase (PgdA/CDA1 family)